MGAQRRAVIVGIDGYAEAPLAACKRDATEMAELLALEQYDFDAQLLLDDAASRSGILRLLSEHAYGEEQGETLLFYFAGHGMYVGNSGHLVTIDAEGYDPGISLASIAQLMESASERFEHVITILDCCHAGAAFNWPHGRTLRASDVEREVPVVNQSRCILAACRADQTTIELPSGHGIFTEALLDGMLGNAVDFQGAVTLFGLHEYCSRTIPESVATPMFRGDMSGTVVLGRGFEPRIGAPVGTARLAELLGKAHRLLDELDILEQTERRDRTHYLSGGALRCAESVERCLRWFSETERELPDVQRDPAWKRLTVRLRAHQRTQAEVSVGMRIRRGEVVREIGHGGFGHVWEVRQDPASPLAFKAFHGNELDDAVKVQRFENGYHVMLGLDHPRVVRVHELVRAPFGFYMDAIPGQNLRQLYYDKADTDLIVRLLKDVAETVLHAHSRGVRHRDIKPENIIVVYQEDGALTPYLTDFDLAYHETNRTMTTMLGVGGVINYAAPEQLFEPNTAKARASTVDIYSLAQLMFFVIVGRDPKPEDPAANVEMLRNVLSSWTEGRVAEPLLECYVEATKRSPEDRMQTVEEFIRLLAMSEARLLATHGSDRLNVGDFCARLGHVYAGLGRYDLPTEEEVQTESTSGQVSVIVRIQDAPVKKGVQTVNLEIELSVRGSIPVPSMKSGKDARNAINSRLDRVLKRHQKTRRQAGSKGAYQVFVYCADVPCTAEGVTFAHGVLVDAISAIENW